MYWICGDDSAVMWFSEALPGGSFRMGLWGHCPRVSVESCGEEFTCGLYLEGRFGWIDRVIVVPKVIRESIYKKRPAASNWVALFQSLSAPICWGYSSQEAQLLKHPRAINLSGSCLNHLSTSIRKDQYRILREEGNICPPSWVS